MLEENQELNCKKSRKRGSLVIGITLLILGVIFLLDNLGIVDMLVLWPLLFIGIGFGLIIKYFWNKN